MADQIELRAQMNGLVTEPSRIIAGQSGFVALDNALCKSPGLVEPRGGLDFHWSADANTSNDATTIRAQEWQDHVWTVGTDGTDMRVRMDDTGTTQITIAGYQQSVQCELMADRQCWTFDKAARMQDLPGASSVNFTRMVGAPRSHGFYATTIAAIRGGSLAANSATAYRVVIVRHPNTSDGDSADTHRASLYGAPSERRIVRNSGAGVVTAQLNIPLLDLLIGDEVQIYRTLTAVTPYTADPGDEMYMCFSAVISANTTSLDEYIYYDDLADGEWSGPALYSNATQEGILLSNYRPRTPTDVAYYNGMAFYAGDRGAYTATCNLLTLGAGGLCSVRFDGLTAVGSPVITGVNATAFPYFHVGMVVRISGINPDNASPVTMGGQIVSTNLGALTITLDANATGVSAGPFIAWDWVGTAESDLTTFRRIYAEYVDTSGLPLAFALNTYNPTAYTFPNASGVFAFTDNAAFGGWNGGGQDMERAFAFHNRSAVAINGAYTRLYVTEGGTSDKQGITLTFIRDCNTNTDGALDYTVSPFVVVTSAPRAFNVTMSRVYTGTLRGDRLLSSRERLPSSLIWSKKLQPEAVPLPYQLNIGTSSEPIVRVIATNDRLWIFKTDGLWSCYGDTPESLTFQQVDPTLRLTWDMSTTPTNQLGTSTAPWVTRLGNEVYAWTNGGIFSISSAGVQRIDQAIETDIKMRSPSGSVLAGGSLYSAASINDSIVVFGMQFATKGASLALGPLYAYHTGSRTWSTWSTSALDLVGFFSGQGASDAGNFVLGGILGWVTYKDDPREDYAATTADTTVPPVHRSDRIVGTGAVNAAGTIVSHTGTSAELTWDVLPMSLPTGSIIVDSVGAMFVVMNADNLAALTLDRAGITDGACSILWPAIGTLKYAATTQGAPASWKTFKRAYYGFQSIRGGLWFDVAFRIRGQTSTTSSTEYFPDPETPATLPTEIGLALDREYEAMRDIPTDQTQGTGLETTITISQAAMYYALDSLTILAESVGSTIGGRS